LRAIRAAARAQAGQVVGDGTQGQDHRIGTESAAGQMRSTEVAAKLLQPVFAGIGPLAVPPHDLPVAPALPGPVHGSFVHHQAEGLQRPAHDLASLSDVPDHRRVAPSAPVEFESSLVSSQEISFKSICLGIIYVSNERNPPSLYAVPVVFRHMPMRFVVAPGNPAPAALAAHQDELVRFTGISFRCRVKLP